MLAPLEHRYLSIQDDGKIVGSIYKGDPHIKRLARVMLMVPIDIKEPEDIVTHLIYKTYQRPYKKELLEAALISGAEPKEINAAFGIPENMTELYMHLFFDMNVFEDRLDIIEYVQMYSKSKFGKEAKEFAIKLGKEAFFVRYGSASYAIDARHVHESIMSMAYMLGTLAKSNPTDSSTAKEAMKWAQLSIKASSTKPQQSQSAAKGIEQIRIALQTKNEIETPENSDIDPTEILH